MGNKDPLNPCVSVCSITSIAADSICKGCGRTNEEFAGWGAYTRQQKISAMEVGKYRLENYAECTEEYNKLKRITNEYKNKVSPSVRANSSAQHFSPSGIQSWSK